MLFGGSSFGERTLSDTARPARFFGALLAKLIIMPSLRAALALVPRYRATVKINPDR